MNKSALQLRKYNNSALAINRSTLNNSTAKILNTFSKTPRFRPPRLPPYYLHKCQTEPNITDTVKTLRHPTIPKSQRTFYFNKEKEKQQGPSPQSYHIKHEDQIWKVHHRNSSVGKAIKEPLKQVKPGPTDYNKPELIRRSFNKSCTFEKSPRNTSHFFNTRGLDSPGPKYELLTGFSSKIKEKATIPQTSKKWQQKQQKSNKYQQKLARCTTQLLQQELINKKDNNRPSPYQKRSKSKDTFTKSNRPRMVPPLSPGPGNYVTFSEFSGWI